MLTFNAVVYIVTWDWTSAFETWLKLTLIRKSNQILPVCTHEIIINHIIGNSCVPCNLHLSDEWPQKVIFAINKIL